MANQTKATTLAQLQSLIEGLQKQLPSGQFTLENNAYTTATLVQTIQSLYDAIAGLNTAQANAKAALITVQTTNARVGPVVMALKRTLQSMYGSAAVDTLAVFALRPRKAPGPRTTEQKAAAAAKAAATRKARGTLGKKEKLAIKGNVTGVQITPITAPATEEKS
jgi:hypothetical protein